MHVQQCPRCNGGHVREIDVDLWRCFTVREEQVWPPQPDPRDPRRPLVEFVEVRCGHQWHSPRPRGGATPMCRCGTIAAGECQRCRRPVCVVHSSVDTERICRKTTSQYRQDLVEMDTESERQAEAWFARRDDPAFCDRLFPALVSAMERSGQPPRPIRTVERGREKRSIFGNFKGHDMIAATIGAGWEVFPPSTTTDSEERFRGRTWSTSTSTVLGVDGGWWKVATTTIHHEPLLEPVTTASNVRESVDRDERELMHRSVSDFLRSRGLTPRDIGFGDEWPLIPVLGSAHHPESGWGYVHPGTEVSWVPDDCVPLGAG